LKAGHHIVDTVAKIHLEGNVIPHNWFNNIKLESGKPDVISIILLSEIVYWYRPTIIKDESTGMIKEVKKRFKADLLQRSYESFADQFGFTKRQVKDAIKRLEDYGLITRVFRNIETNNIKLSNVLFIELHADKVARITFESDVPLKRQTYDDKTEEVLRLNVIPMTINRQTNTENTTEITTEITTSKYVGKDATDFYQQNFGMLSPFIIEDIQQWCNDLSDELVIEAMKIALQRNKHTWAYVRGILNEWAKRNVKTVNDVQALQVQHRNNTKNTYKPKRQELIPDWLNGQQEEDIPIDPDFEEEKRKVEELLKQYRK
jgi:DnaD/phage-associated family protein